MYHTYRSDKVEISHIRGVDTPFTLFRGVNFDFRAYAPLQLFFLAFEMILIMYHTYRSAKVEISPIRGVVTPFTPFRGVNFDFRAYFPLQLFFGLSRQF